MADDFDDLFTSPGAVRPSAFASYGAGDDDEFSATANPFADLESSSVAVPRSTFHGGPHAVRDEAAGLSDGLQHASIHDEPAPAAVSRRESSASTSEPATLADETVSSEQRLESDEYKDATQPQQDRVLVSPFVAPSDDEQGPSMSREPSHAESHIQANPFDVHVPVSPGFDNGFGSPVPPPSATALDIRDLDTTNGFQHDEPTQSPPEPQTSFNLRPESINGERAEVASVRTVGLESDGASIRGEQPLIHPEPVVQSAPLHDEPSGRPTFVVTVGEPTKVGSAIDPITSHTVYTIRTRTSSTSFRKHDFSVLRRYRDFLWLFERLNENNPGVIVPPPPEKAAIGRFSQHFVETRRQALQQCLEAILRHPMLYTDPDLKTFLESDTFNIDVKQRASYQPSGSASSEPKSGFFASLTSPRFAEFDEFFDARRASIDTLEASLKSLTSMLHACSKTRVQVSTSAGELSQALQALSTCELSEPVKKAVADLAKLENMRRQVVEAHAKEEEQVLLATADQYLRLIGSVRTAFQSRIKSYQAYQRAESNVKTVRAAHEKAKKSQRSNPELTSHTLYEVTEAERRAIQCKRDFDEASKLIKSELSRFDKEKVEDVKSAVQRYSQGLVQRQQDVVNAWKEYISVAEKAAAQLQTRPADQANGQGAQLAAA